MYVCQLSPLLATKTAWAKQFSTFGDFRNLNLTSENSQITTRWSQTPDKGIGTLSCKCCTQEVFDYSQFSGNIEGSQTDVLEHMICFFTAATAIDPPPANPQFTQQYDSANLGLDLSTKSHKDPNVNCFSRRNCWLFVSQNQKFWDQRPFITIP